MGRSRAGRQGIDSIQDTGNTNEGDVIRLALGLKDPNRPVKLALSKIRRDGGTQPRAALNPEVVEDYAEAMRAKKKLPPAIVFYDGTDYWLVDGFHRVAAVELNDGTEYYFIVKEGTRRDAVLFSLGVNDEHGLRRTNDDKRQSVMTMLQDQEWVGWSDHEIAKQCKVSHGYVGKIRTSLDSESSEVPAARTFVTKHGTTAKMATKGIRQANKERAAVLPEEQRRIKKAKEGTQGMPQASVIELPGMITDQVIAALHQGDMTWTELLQATKQGMGQDIAPSLFNSVLRDMQRSSLIAPSPHDQAAFTLGEKAGTQPGVMARPAPGERPLPKLKTMARATGEGDTADLEVDSLRKGIELVVTVNDALFQVGAERMDVIDIRRLLDEVQAAFDKLHDIGRWLEIEVE
ncbi:MAG: ParB N-terminal domain-containing protein [Chloroflexi bacterium]|nr:ParB N-terminal domain-containing protein [Chloroflexota bacterium]